MKILLSPAKAMDEKRSFELVGTSNIQFIKETEYLVQKLQKFSKKKIGDLMHLSDSLAALNYQRFQNWTTPNSENSVVKPAIQLFDGAAYRGLDVNSFSKDDIKNMQQKLRILSGLYGILRPLDLIAPYRLEMGTKWEISKKEKNLYQYWSDKITQSLNEETASKDVIINLASTEYFKAINQKEINSRIITPVFKELKGNQYKVVMMYAKTARGKMTRAIIQNNYSSGDLKAYNIDGYSFNESLSSENEWVFVR